MWGSARRAFAVLAVNTALFVALFAVLEVATRVVRDGALRSDPGPHAAPRSALGTTQWVIYDAELGYRLNPAWEGVNALSIRHGAIAVPKPAGLFRVVVLGDSIPWDSPGFVDELRPRLRGRGPVELINASVPGYTTYQEVRFFARYVARTAPDLVIWTYCLNDNHRFLHVFDEDARMLLTSEAMESVRSRSWWGRLAARSRVLSAIRLGLLARRESWRAAGREFPWEGSPAFETAWHDDAWLRYEEHLREMLALLARDGARLALVVFPFEPQLNRRTRRDRLDYILKPQTRLRELCTRYGVPCLDLFPAFAARYDRGEKLYRDRIHLNAGGHRLTAAEVLRFLDGAALLPPGRTAAGGGPPLVAGDPARVWLRPWNDAR